MTNEFSSTKKRLLDFKGAQACSRPFPHFVVPECLDEVVAERLLDWFDHEAPWKVQEMDGFYKLYKVSLMEVQLPQELQFLIEDQFIDEIRECIGSIFNLQFSGPVQIDAHLLTTGFKIGIHTDFGETNQTHRFLIQLNRGWNAKNGGYLVLLPTNAPSDVSAEHMFYAPTHRSGIGFAISERSFHAVTPVTNGKRFTLCYSIEREHAVQQ